MNLRLFLYTNLFQTEQQQRINISVYVGKSYINRPQITTHYFRCITEGNAFLLDICSEAKNYRASFLFGQSEGKNVPISECVSERQTDRQKDIAWNTVCVSVCVAN